MNLPDIRSLFLDKRKFLKISPDELKKVKIKFIKKYTDKRSYSFVAIYKFGSKTFVGVANSDGRKKYAFQVNKFLKRSLAQAFVPQPIFYNEKYGFFLMEFLPGRNFGEILKDHPFRFSSFVREIVKLLAIFQKIKISNRTGLNKKIDFKDFKKNIEILKKRGDKRVKEIISLFKEVKKGIRNKEKKVFVHGDFNPYNIIFTPSRTIKIVDFEKAHLGERIIDLANFCSHIDSPDFSFLKNRDELKNFFLDEYQKKTKKLTKQEWQRFSFYKLYFDLLILTHSLVWNPQKKFKIQKSK